MKRIILILFVLVFTSFAKEKTLLITSGFAHPETDFLERVIQEGFDRVDLGLNYQTLPTQRSLTNANNGISDGEASRIFEINQTYPNLIPITTPIYAIELVVLSKKKIFIEDVSDLKKYHVGVIRGYKIAERIVSAQKPLSYNAVSNHKTLIKMLLNDRLDVIVTNKIALMTQTEVSKDQPFYLKSSPIISKKLYMHLHKKHKELVPQFEKVFQAIIDEGLHAKIKSDFYKNIEKDFRERVTIVEYD